MPSHADKSLEQIREELKRLLVSALALIHRAEGRLPVDSSRPQPCNSQDHREADRT